MATWSIEHIPANGGASTFASLGVWGFASLQMQFVNWGIDQAAVTTRGGSIAFEAAQFAYLDKLVVWRNGTRFAHFWVTGLGATAEAHESRTYTLSGPSWWLSNLPFRWPYWPVKATIESSDKTASMWLQYALMSAISLGAPIAHESGSTGYGQFSAPAGDLSASRTCMEVVQRAARVHPMSSGTWDMAGETPSFIVRTRSNLAAQSIAVSDSIETFGLAPNHEIQAKGVHIMYVYGDNATVGADDVAGESPYLSGPNTLEILVQVADADAAWHANFLGIAAKLYEGLGTLVWTGALNFHEVDTADIPLVRPGASINLTGGLAEWSTMAACAQSVAWSVGPNTNDLCTVTFGAPEQLGVQDLIDFAAAGYTSAACAGGNPSPYTPPPPTLDNGPTPGTYNDLNGGTGGGTPEGIIAVQTRGGPWAVAGIRAYDLSEHWYLRQEWSGSITHTVTSPTTGTVTLVFSGVGSRDPSAGLTASTLAMTVSRSGYDFSDLQSQTAITWDANMYTHYLHWVYVYPTQITATQITAVAEADQGGGASGTGAQYSVASDECTPVRARDAMLEVAEWAAGETTALSVSTASSPPSGIERRIRYRTEHTEGGVAQPTLTGLAPWSRYRLRGEQEVCPVDATGAATGAWAAYGVIHGPAFITDSAGVGGHDWTDAIAAPEGYELRVTWTPEQF